MDIILSDLELHVRSATAADIPLLLSFIKKLADFEKLEVATTEEILTTSLFGERPAAQALLGFVGEQPAAYAIYFFTFASMVGKRGLWLDDLYVNPEFRGKGIGKALMTYLADIALRNSCTRLEWTVLDWNKTAISFYEGLGAKVHHDWRICRLDESNIAAVARQHDMVQGSG